jgi:hypothetical protein
MGDLIFHKNQHSPPVTLADLLGNIAKWVIKNVLALPCEVKAPFEPPIYVQFPGTNFDTPIYAMTVILESTRFAIGYEIDVPPKLIKYIYSDILSL